MLALLSAWMARPAIAQTNGTDAATTTQTSVTCCSLRIVRETVNLDAGNFTHANLELEWTDAAGVVVRTESVVINDGNPAITTDNLLTGTGVGGQPFGYLRAVGETPASETGTIPRRWRRRRVQWLKDHAMLTNNAITVQ